LRILAGKDGADFDLAGLARLLVRPFLALGSGLPASGAGVVASDGLVDWLVSSAKAGKLEMIMMPAVA
jgi:hypothetical protein